MTLKVLMVVAPRNFRDEELFTPKKILEDAGVKVSVASRGVNEATGAVGARVNVDVDVSQANAADYDAVVFIGGAGAAVYFNDPVVLKLAGESFSAGKLTAAICIAPSILANAGILQGRKATSFPSEKGNLVSKGATYVSQPVVEDGLIVTAVGPQAAGGFGRKLVGKLTR
ncbi:MAG: DJ-1/PfpI family protein [Candidatus Altiarchaeota archaeon]|nr:DJ-1/PfpI family protein [Candidatus Altiarchaeota archaeon]